MVTELLSRELKATSFMSLKKSRRFSSLISSVVISLALILLEVFTYKALYSKVEQYSGFNKHLYVLIMFIATLFVVFYLVNVTYKAFFKDQNEKIILGTRPISTYQIVLAKSLYVLIKSVISSFVVLFPIACTYLAMSNAYLPAYIYLVYFIVLTSIFATFVSLLLAIPYKVLFDLLKKYKVAYLVVSILISFALAYVYSYILDIFVNLVSDSDLSYIFTTGSMSIIESVTSKLYPCSFLVDISLEKNVFTNFLIYFIVIFGLGIVSMLLFTLFYSRYLHKDESEKAKDILNLQVKLTSPSRALIKKEFVLMFTSGEGLSSYASLLVLQPFLVYLVVSAINIIFSGGNLVFISSLFPNVMVGIDSLLVFLFLAVINSTSSISLSSEKNTLIIMKYIPVSYVKQMGIKLLIPYAFSSLSYLVTILVLAISGEISFVSFALLIIVGLLLLFIISLGSIYTDLKSKKNASLLNTLTSFILPVLSVGAGVLLSLVFDNEILSYYMFFVIILAFEAVELACMLVKAPQRIQRDLNEYVGGNL